MKNSGAPIKKNNFRAKDGRKKFSEKSVHKRKSLRSSEEKHTADNPYPPRNKKSSDTGKSDVRHTRKDAEGSDRYKKKEYKPYDKDRRDGASYSERPKKSYDKESPHSEKPNKRRPFGKDAGKSDHTKKEYKPYEKDRRDGTPYSERPKKSFGKENPRSERPYKRRPFDKDDGKEGYKRKEYKPFDKDRRTGSGKSSEKYFHKKEDDAGTSYSHKTHKPYDKENQRSEKPYKRRPFDKDDGKGSYKKKEYKSSDKDREKKSDRPYEHSNRDNKTEHTSHENAGHYQDDSGDQKRRKPRIPRKRTYTGRKHEYRDVEIHVKDNTYAKRPSLPDLSETNGVRLNKFIANAGICSRREADILIETGVITINGKIITQLGTKVMPGDVVKYNDQVLCGERLQYLLLNKPKDYITTTDDPQERKTVMEIIRDACKERIYPVGRLDKNTSGLLLFTNDGELAKKLTHPKYQVEKVYKAELDKPLLKSDMDKIAEGIELEDGSIKVDAIEYGETKKEIGIELHSGKNRIVRRIFESLGYEVVKLDRVVFAGLTKKDLPRGKYRFLSNEEVNILRRIR